MAIGDLVGDLATAYLSPAQRAAMLKSATNTTGVVGRAQQQLAPVSLASLAPSVAAQTAPAVAPNIAGLASAAPGATTLGAASPQSPGPQSLASLAPGMSPISVAPSFPAASQQQLASLGPAGQPAVPANTPVASLQDAYRPTGIGQGSNAIAARTSATGTSQFTNAPADLASAAGLAKITNTPQQPASGPTSLADIMPGSGAAPGSNAEFASLGSAKNIGDGIGTFSQANAGDAALAMGRFQKANDLRSIYADQDRLRNAVAAQVRDRNFNVVRDSSQPITRQTIQADQERAGRTQSLADAVTGAQGLIDTRRQGVTADQQQRQAARLEDLAVAASGPDATPEAQNRLFAAADPKGYAQTQREAPLKALEVQNKQLDNTRLQQQITTANTTQQQSTQDRALAKESKAATFDQALASIDTLAGVPGDKSRPEHPGLTKSLGIVDATLPTLPGTDAADFQAQLETLKAQTFLPQVEALKGAGALSDAEGAKLSASVGALSTRMTEDAFRKSLKDVRATLTAAKERSAKGGPVATSSATPASTAAPASGAPAVGTVQQGYVFLGGDPASQSSWRAQ